MRKTKAMDSNVYYLPPLVCGDCVQTPRGFLLNSPLILCMHVHVCVEARVLLRHHSPFLKFTFIYAVYVTPVNMEVRNQRAGVSSRL